MTRACSSFPTRRRALGLALGLAGAATLAPGVGARQARAQAGLERLRGTDPARPLPDFAFTTADGARRTLADVPARGWVINLWGTWCAPCREEMPALDRMAAALKADNIALLALAWEFGPSPAENVARFYAQHGIVNLAVWLDPRGAAGRVLAVPPAEPGARPASPRYPTTLLVNATRQEVARAEGALAWDSADAIAMVRRYLGAS